MSFFRRLTKIQEILPRDHTILLKRVEVSYKELRTAHLNYLHAYAKYEKDGKFIDKYTDGTYQSYKLAVNSYNTDVKALLISE